MKNKKPCRALLFNCSLSKGHRGDCVPKKKPKPERSSPCAGECKHLWCSGYSAGYDDGYDDGNNDKKNGKR